MLVFCFGVGSLVVSIIDVFAIDNDPMFHNWEIREWVLSLMVSLVSILGSIVMTKALYLVTLSKVMPALSFEVVAAYTLQITVFDVPTHLLHLAGTMCVTLAVIAMGMEDYLMERFNWRSLSTTTTTLSMDNSRTYNQVPGPNTPNSKKEDNRDVMSLDNFLCQSPGRGESPHIKIHSGESKNLYRGVTTPITSFMGLSLIS